MARLSFAEEMKRVAETRAARRKPIPKEATLAVVVASNRPSDLKDLLQDLLHQSLPKFEVHLGCHGFTPSAELKSGISKLTKRGISTTVKRFEKEATLGSILSDLARATKTAYVSKMDDDDIYGPNHLSDLMSAILDKKCAVVGRAMNYIYLEPLDLTVRRFTGVGISEVELFSDFVCGGTILVERSYGEKANWFGTGVTAVDKHLLDGVRAQSGTIWRTFGAGYIYRRRSNQHTYATNYSKYLEGSSDQWVGILQGEEFGVRR